MNRRKEVVANLAVIGNLLVAATVIYTILTILQSKPLNAGKQAR